MEQASGESWKPSNDPELRAAIESLASLKAWTQTYGAEPWIDLPPQEHSSAGVARTLSTMGVERSTWDSATAAERRAVKRGVQSLLTAFAAVDAILSRGVDSIAKFRAEEYLSEIARLHDKAARQKTGFVRDQERERRLFFGRFILWSLKPLFEDPEFTRALAGATAGDAAAQSMVLGRLNGVLHPSGVQAAGNSRFLKASDLENLSTRSTRKAMLQIVRKAFPWLATEDLRIGKVRRRPGRRR
jgi:hypothetical protein